MVPPPRTSKCGDAKAKTNTILVISEDASFLDRLCRIGKEERVTVVRADESDEALEALRTAQPIAVLLDLDLADNAAWDIADRLLQEENCPQLLLVTGRVGHFDLEAAHRAGSVLDKATEASWLFGVLSRRALEPDSAQAARNSIQRVLIRWLRPCEWPLPAIRAQRWWGINE
jgi:ActR/RegA family two-component response regulator